MANLFAASDIAAGYANARPPVHPKVIEKLQAQLGGGFFARGLDVGCGSGLSTRALAAMVEHAIGIEPAESMLPWANQVAPGASFLAGAAEALPFADRTIDVITAAGSLNYSSDVPQFFREAKRVLQPSGTVAVYDFSPGRRTEEGSDLEVWFDEFMRRYPRAQDNASALDPRSLAAEAEGSGMQLRWHEDFHIPLVLTQDFYVEYMMTETNVAYAIEKGKTGADKVRDWLRESLTPVFLHFQGEGRKILFDGYIALFQA